MSNFEKWLVAVHVVCAVIWVGGAFYTQIFALRAQGTGAVALGPFAKDTEVLGFRIFLPASVLLLASGIWLITTDVFKLEGWNVYGLAVIAVSIVNGAGFLGPESGRIGALLDERGDDDPEVRRRIGRLFLVSRVELALLISVILVMVLKPGT
jgi:uncharacterized membrane protein